MFRSTSLLSNNPFVRIRGILSFSEYGGFLNAARFAARGYWPRMAAGAAAGSLIGGVAGGLASDDALAGASIGVVSGGLLGAAGMFGWQMGVLARSRRLLPPPTPRLTPPSA